MKCLSGLLIAAATFYCLATAINGEETEEVVLPFNDLLPPLANAAAAASNDNDNDVDADVAIVATTKKVPTTIALPTTVAPSVLFQTTEKSYYQKQTEHIKELHLIDDDVLVPHNYTEQEQHLQHLHEAQIVQHEEHDAAQHKKLIKERLQQIQQQKQHDQQEIKQMQITQNEEQQQQQQHGEGQNLAEDNSKAKQVQAVNIPTLDVTVLLPPRVDEPPADASEVNKEKETLHVVASNEKFQQQQPQQKQQPTLEQKEKQQFLKQKQQQGLLKLVTGNINSNNKQQAIQKQQQQQQQQSKQKLQLKQQSAYKTSSEYKATTASYNKQQRVGQYNPTKQQNLGQYNPNPLQEGQYRQTDETSQLKPDVIEHYLNNFAQTTRVPRRGPLPTLTPFPRHLKK